MIGINDCVVGGVGISYCNTAATRWEQCQNRCENVCTCKAVLEEGLCGDRCVRGEKFDMTSRLPDKRSSGARLSSSAALNASAMDAVTI